jgi:anthranilate phosphoribosyltransferase
MQGLLQGQALELLPAVLWNGGFYLWRCGICEDLETALGRAESLLTSGQVGQKLAEIKKAIAVI